MSFLFSLIKKFDIQFLNKIYSNKTLYENLEYIFLSNNIFLQNEFKDNYANFLKIEYIYSYSRKFFISNINQMCINLLKVNKNLQIINFSIFFLKEFEKTPIYLQTVKVFIRYKIYQPIYKFFQKKKYQNSDSILIQKSKNFIVRVIDIRLLICFQVKNMLERIFNCKFSAIFLFLINQKRIGVVQGHINISILIFKIIFVIILLNIFKKKKKIKLSLYIFFLKFIFSKKKISNEWLIDFSKFLYINFFLNTDIIGVILNNMNKYLSFRKMIYEKKKKKMNANNFFDIFIFIYVKKNENKINTKLCSWLRIIILLNIIKNEEYITNIFTTKYIRNFDQLNLRKALIYVIFLRNEKNSKERIFLNFFFQVFKFMLKRENLVKKLAFKFFSYFMIILKKNNNIKKSEYQLFNKNFWFNVSLRIYQKDFFHFLLKIYENRYIKYISSNNLLFPYLLDTLYLHILIKFLILFKKVYIFSNKEKVIKIRNFLFLDYKTKLKNFSNSFRLIKKLRKYYKFFILSNLIIKRKIFNFNLKIGINLNMFIFLQFTNFKLRNNFKNKISVMILLNLKNVLNKVNKAIKIIKKILSLKISIKKFFRKKFSGLPCFLITYENKFSICNYRPKFFIFIFLLRILINLFKKKLESCYLSDLLLFYNQNFLKSLTFLIIIFINYKITIYQSGRNIYTFRTKFLHKKLNKNYNLKKKKFHRKIFFCKRFYSFIIGKMKKKFEFIEKIENFWFLHTNISKFLYSKKLLNDNLNFWDQKINFYNNFNMTLTNNNKMNRRKFFILRFTLKLFEMFSNFASFKMDNKIILILISFDWILNSIRYYKAFKLDPSIKKYLKLIKNEIFGIIYEIQSNNTYKLNYEIIYWLDCHIKLEKIYSEKKNLIIISHYSIYLEYIELIVKNIKSFNVLTNFLENYKNIESFLKYIKISNYKSRSKIMFQYEKKINFLVFCLDIFFKNLNKDINT